MPKDEEKETFVGPDSLKEKEERDKNSLEQIAQNVGLISQAISGLTMAATALKSSLDEVNKSLVTAREELNSLVSLLVVGKTADNPVDLSKPQEKPLLSPKPEQTTPKPQPTSTPQSVPQQPSSNKAVEDVRMMFPADIDALLNFEDKGDYVSIKPKQFLGSENFAKIASIVRGIGGEYISAGRDSHFRVYKKK